MADDDASSIFQFTRSLDVVVAVVVCGCNCCFSWLCFCVRCWLLFQSCHTIASFFFRFTATIRAISRMIGRLFPPCIRSNFNYLLSNSFTPSHFLSPFASFVSSIFVFTHVVHISSWSLIDGSWLFYIISTLLDHFFNRKISILFIIVSAAWVCAYGCFPLLIFNHILGHFFLLIFPCFAFYLSNRPLSSIVPRSHSVCIPFVVWCIFLFHCKVKTLLPSQRIGFRERNDIIFLSFFDWKNGNEFLHYQ